MKIHFLGLWSTDQERGSVPRLQIPYKGQGQVAFRSPHPQAEDVQDGV